MVTTAAAGAIFGRMSVVATSGGEIAVVVAAVVVRIAVFRGCLMVTSHYAATFGFFGLFCRYTYIPGNCSRCKQNLCKNVFFLPKVYFSHSY